MSEIQNVFTVSDDVYCPEGEGKVIVDYVENLFSRVSSKVAELNGKVDWLLIKSGELGDIAFSSQWFFEENLEKKLREHDENISVVRMHAKGCGGAVGEDNIERWIKEKLDKEEVSLNYVNSPNLNYRGFVGYHLVHGE